MFLSVGISGTVEYVEEQIPWEFLPKELPVRLIKIQQL